MSRLFRCAFIALALLSSPVFRQSELPQWKRNFISDLGYSGIGVSMYRPNMSPFAEIERPFVGTDILLTVLHINLSQGTFNRTVGAPWQLTQDGNLTPPPVPVSRANFGLQLPLPFIGLESINNYQKDFRFSAFVRANWGWHRFQQFNENNPKAHSTAELAPGVRFRFPYGSIDLALSVNWISESIEELPTYYLQDIPTRQVYPTVTFRLDGLFDGMSRGISTSQGATYSSSRDTEKRRYTDAQGRRMEETTTTYTTTARAKTVSLTDIGIYGGLGLKATRSGMALRGYSSPGTLFGVTGLFRNGVFAGSVNLEGGRIGHAGTLQTWKDDYRRRVDKTETHGTGTANTFNFFADVGMSINNLIYTALGTAVVDDVAKPYSSINIGFSFGAHALWGQEFDDPAASNAFYDNLDVQERWFTDPREMKGGLMGGCFVSWDIGNASFKAQLYRYRRAPMANSLMHSVAWRFGGSEPR